MRVAIIGGGLVGAFLAWKLSIKGNRVTIFEQKARTGKHACSGLISERIWNFIPKNDELIQNVISGTIIHLPKKDIRINFVPQMLVFNRPALDRYVLNLAFDAGIRFVVEKIEELPKNFDLIIGCDGALSVVRKLIGLPQPKFRLGILCRLNQKDASNYVETWPLRKGFAWRIPRGDEVEYGVLAPIDVAHEEFLHFCIKQNIQPVREHAGLIPCDFIVPKNRNVTLCGDALGLTKPWSGGGVIWSLTAAQILIESFPNFAAYHRALKKFFWPKLLASRFATNLGYFASKFLSQTLPKENSIDADFFPFKYEE